MILKTLQPGDETQLEAFLAQYWETSMFLRSNLRRAGLLDRGNPFEGTYVAAIEQNEIQAVAAHYWNGMIILQAPSHLEAVVQAAIEQSNRPIMGLAGVWQQVQAAQQLLNLNATLAEPEILFSLSLSQLQIPQALSSFRVRPPHLEEFDRLTEWRVAYEIETLNRSASPQLWEDCRKQLENLQNQQAQWVLEVEGSIVSYCAFNAQLPDVVQLGGVWTPPEFRNRGYARCVVAGALFNAKETGIEQAILFTSKKNYAAQNSYRSLGFQAIGEYGLVLCGN